MYEARLAEIERLVEEAARSRVLARHSRTPVCRLFLAACWTDVPELVAEVRRLQALVGSLNRYREGLEGLPEGTLPMSE